MKHKQKPIPSKKNFFPTNAHIALFPINAAEARALYGGASTFEVAAISVVSLLLLGFLYTQINFCLALEKNIILKTQVSNLNYDLEDNTRRLMYLASYP